MYIFLLAWRYLRTRFIAVASIISVTLGVATLIVVNAVMAGFVDQMHTRLHGILSDIEISPPGMGDIRNVEGTLAAIRQTLGDDLEAITATVRVPALLQYRYNDRPMNHQIYLVGIDDETYGKVTDFLPYLMNEMNRQQISFELREDGYDPEIGDCGWPWRRQIAEYEQAWRAQMEQYYEQQRQTALHASEPGLLPGSGIREPLPAGQVTANDRPQREGLPELPDSMPVIPESGVKEQSNGSNLAGQDSSIQYREPVRPEDVFNKGRDQYVGIVIGKAISHRHVSESELGPASDVFLVRPGDDVAVTLPTAGENPKPILENCTVVDLYSSHMHEYDSAFAFMPLSHLQKIRGMVDPFTGERTVSTIQVRTKPGTDLEKVRDSLIALFPPEAGLMVQTWQDTQRPLLNAVNLELTILNILLFLIIGVAGFGILATFFMIVVEKTRDIGILKSLGAPGRGVMSIFLGYGMCLGTVGTGVGIVLGLLFVANINGIADGLQSLSGQEIYDPMIYFFDEIPTIVSPWMVTWVALGAIAIAVLASVLPALRAARLHPVEALRYE